MIVLRILPLCLVSLAAPFNGQKLTNYNEELARKYLQLSAAAYGMEHEKCVNATYPSNSHSLLVRNDQECDIWDSTCSSYFVKSDATQELIIVFRGTKTKVQLFAEGWNSIQPSVPFIDMGNVRPAHLFVSTSIAEEVNRYFYTAHEAMWPPVEQLLKDEKYRNYRVSFTGHSLGGALAALAAARTAKTGLRPGNAITLYTFGEPRVGSAKFANNFDAMIKESYRVVFRRDIVPHLPACRKDESKKDIAQGASLPCDSFEGTQSYHHGTEIWYPDTMEPNAKYVECLGMPKNEDFSCSDQLTFKFSDMTGYVSDHRHYFNVKVTKYGKAGCSADEPVVTKQSTGVWQGVREKVSSKLVSLRGLFGK